MRHMPLAKTLERLSCLSLGTWTWGTLLGPDDPAVLLHAYVDAGGTVVDTGPTYGDGASERALGDALRLVGREKLLVATKVEVQSCGNVDFTPRALLGSLDASLARLRVDHVDILQLHRWSNDLSLDVQIDGLYAAVASGRARYIGVCNYDGKQVSAAADVCKRRLPGKFVSLQSEYSLLNRQAQHNEFPAARRVLVSTFAWSPLAHGVLSGRYRHGTPPRSRGTDDRFSEYPARYEGQRTDYVVDALTLVAAALGRTAAQVALGWVLAQQLVDSAVVGPRTSAQLHELIAAANTELQSEVLEMLTDVSFPHT